MLPLLGGPELAGLNVGADMAIGSLVRHWIYVIPFIFLINKEQIKKIDQSVASQVSSSAAKKQR